MATVIREAKLRPRFAIGSTIGRTAVESPQPLYRVDKFTVPKPARREFLRRLRQTHDLLRTLPGFIQDFVFEQTSGPGVFNFVTVVIWDGADALAAAKKAVREKYKEIGFDPGETFKRLGIKADLANYSRILDNQH